MGNPIGYSQGAGMEGVWGRAYRFGLNREEALHKHPTKFQTVWTRGFEIRGIQTGFGFCWLKSIGITASDEISLTRLTWEVPRDWRCDFPWDFLCDPTLDTPLCASGGQWASVRLNEIQLLQVGLRGILWGNLNVHSPNVDTPLAGDGRQWASDSLN